MDDTGAAPHRDLIRTEDELRRLLDELTLPPHSAGPRETRDKRTDDLVVRMFLFGLLTLFETRLLELVQHVYDDQSLGRVLKPARLAAARRLLAERGKRGEQLRLVDCLQVADKRDLLLAEEGFAERFGYDSKKSAHRFFTQVEMLRDRLVHAQDLVAASSWEEVAETARQLAEFLRVDERQGEQTAD
ncbi:MAG: hypothetical protein J5I93_14130 [Pirellulaceae bacterium]|nr:hypothetical protein [Pirellulaceae bacterium]